MSYDSNYKVTIEDASDTVVASQSCTCKCVPPSAKFCPECGSAVTRMGYNKQVIKDLLKAKMESGGYNPLELDSSGLSASTEEPCGWYTYRTDIEHFSKGYPTVLFIVTREGCEGEASYERCWIRNGKSRGSKGYVHYQEPEDLASI